MKNIAVIFAGGVGSRMGNSIPKQFLEWNDKAIIIQTIEVFERVEAIDGVILVCKNEWIDYCKGLIKKANLKKVLSVVAGGSTALDSQYNGIKEIKRLFENEKVITLIHDGVRPLVTKETILKNIESVKKYGNAITVTPAIETVITINQTENVDRIIDRSKCRMAKAPQSFWLDDILKVHEESISEEKHNYIDSASMMMAYGYRLHIIEGEMENIKITTPSDYYMYLGISKERSTQNDK